MPLCIAPSNIPVSADEIEENLGQSEGSTSSHCILGIWMNKEPDIAAAIKEAVEKKEGDALINIQCYEKNRFYLFYSIKKIRITGEVVKLKKSEDTQ